MSAFKSHAAYTSAVALVTAGLQSGSIKLQGSSDSGHTDKNIERDSKYLNGLINALAANLSVK